MTDLNKNRLEAALKLAEGRLSLLLNVFPEPDGNSDHPGATRYVLERVRSALSHVTPSTDRGGEPVAWADPRDLGETFFSVYGERTALNSAALYLAPPTSDAIRAGAFEEAANRVRELARPHWEGAARVSDANPDLDNDSAAHEYNTRVYIAKALDEAEAAIRALALPHKEPHP